MAKSKRKSSRSDEFGDKEPAAADGSEAALVQKAVEEWGEIAPPEAVAPPEEEAPYTVGTWGGMTQFACKLCPWDTLKGEAAMLEHLASAHAPPPKPKSPILIADKSGRQIN